jgi:hypothetical protein
VATGVKVITARCVAGAGLVAAAHVRKPPPTTKSARFSAIIGPERVKATGGLRFWKDGRDVREVTIALYDDPAKVFSSFSA